MVGNIRTFCTDLGRSREVCGELSADVDSGKSRAKVCTLPTADLISSTCRVMPEATHCSVNLTLRQTSDWELVRHQRRALNKWRSVRVPVSVLIKSPKIVSHSAVRPA